MHLTRQVIRQVVLEELETWPLHHRCTPCVVINMGTAAKPCWSLNYGRAKHRMFGYNLHWEANIKDGVFYLLSIGIPHSQRGKGIGNDLYERLTLIAEELGCHRIQQFPSGTTFNGETRFDWLLRRGWQPYDGNEVIIELPIRVPTCTNKG